MRFGVQNKEQESYRNKITYGMQRYHWNLITPPSKGCQIARNPLAAPWCVLRLCVLEQSPETRSEWQMRRDREKGTVHSVCVREYLGFQDRPLQV